MHGGRIEAFSEGRDRGSEFRLRLPRVGTVAPAAGQALPQEAATAHRVEALRILVVDDNHDAATGIAAMLELEGHAVRTAHDGEEALAAANAHSPRWSWCWTSACRCWTATRWRAGCAPCPSWPTPC